MPLSYFLLPLSGAFDATEFLKAAKVKLFNS